MRSEPHRTPEMRKPLPEIYPAGGGKSVRAAETQPHGLSGGVPCGAARRTVPVVPAAVYRCVAASLRISTVAFFRPVALHSVPVRSVRTVVKPLVALVDICTS